MQRALRDLHGRIPPLLSEVTNGLFVASLRVNKAFMCYESRMFQQVKCFVCAALHNSHFWPDCLRAHEFTSDRWPILNGSKKILDSMAHFGTLASHEKKLKRLINWDEWKCSKERYIRDWVWTHEGVGGCHFGSFLEVRYRFFIPSFVFELTISHALQL